jgi:hypothetical protein
MKHDIIKTDNYLLIVSDEDIKVGDVFYGIADGSIKPFIKIADENTVEIVNWQLNRSAKSPNKKITKHLPLNNAPILEGVPLLPPLEDDESICPYPEEKQNAVDWHNGYNKAKEKYKYTEEDLRDAYDRGLNNIDSDGCPIDKPSDDINDFIQSLQQPKYPIGFECEIEVCVFGNHTHYDPKIEDYVKPKTTTNSQGQTVLVGKYIW